MTTPTPRRRSLLGHLAGATAATVIVRSCTTLGEAPAATHPDAELFRACEAHALAFRRLNVDYAGGEDYATCPIWQAYDGACEAIATARPRTMAGVLAKARAAKLEAVDPDPSFEDWRSTPAGEWAWEIVGDLLRLTGGRA